MLCDCRSTHSEVTYAFVGFGSSASVQPPSLWGCPVDRYATGNGGCHWNGIGNRSGTGEWVMQNFLLDIFM